MTSIFRRHARGRPPHPDVLTPAEWRVLEEVRAGRSNPEIAERLVLSRNTVKTHISRMLDKLDLRDRGDLAAWQPDPGLGHPRRSFLAAPLGWIASKGTAVGVAALSVVLAAGFVVALESGRLVDSQVESPPAAGVPTEPVPQPSTAASVPDASDLVSVVVTAHDVADVEILVDGAMEFEGTLQPGGSVAREGTSRVEVWTDNAQRVSLIVNGSDLGLFAPAIGQPTWNGVRWSWFAGDSPTPVPTRVSTATPTPAGAFSASGVFIPYPPDEVRWMDKDGFIAVVQWDDRNLTPEEKAADPRFDPRWPDLVECLERAGITGLPPGDEFRQADLDRLITTINAGGPFIESDARGPRYVGTPASDAFLTCAGEVLAGPVP